MIDVLILVLARAGSKRLPQKNVKPFLNTSLLNITLVQATRVKRLLGCEGLEVSIFLSTDLNPQEFELPSEVNLVERPARLSQDSTTSRETILPILEGNQNLKHNTILCVLQPTSPLRYDQDILTAINMLRKCEAESVVSVSRPLQPLKDMVLGLKGTTVLIDCESVDQYRFISGGFYCYTVSNYCQKDDKSLMLNAYLFECSDETGIDIDNEVQFQMAELLYRQHMETQR